MRTEYIIVDTNNNWLATETNKKDAMISMRKLIKMGKKGESYEGMEIGDIVYLFEAKEIMSEKTY